MSQDSLSYLHRDPQKGAAASTAEAVVRGDKKRAMQQLLALVGTTLRRTTKNGNDDTITITERHLVQLKACVDGVYGLAIKLARVEARVEPVVPTTRLLGCSWASRFASTKKRTWTKWMAWLHVAGVVVYQAGTHSNPSLVAFPSLYRWNPSVTRAVVVERLQNGFGVGEATTKELARRGRWWEPICQTLLDNESDAHARAQTAAEHVATWVVKVAEAAAAKKAAILERIADVVDGDVVDAAADRVAEARGRVQWVREQMEACTDDDERAAWRRWAADADRRVLFAEDALRAAKTEKDTAAHPVRALVKLGRAALRRAVSGVGGGTASPRNDGPSSFRRGPRSAAARPGKVLAARAVKPSGAESAAAPLANPNNQGREPPATQAPSSTVPAEAGKGVGPDAPGHIQYTEPVEATRAFAAFRAIHATSCARAEGKL